MDRHNLTEIKNNLMEEVVKRRKLGGYSADAAGILLVAESLFSIVQHLIDKEPKQKKKK